jgi:hypothetical protein
MTTHLSSKTISGFAAVLLIGCVVGAVGFVLGRDSADPAQAQSVVRADQAKRVAAARKAGYERGFADGRRAAERDQRQQPTGSDGGRSEPSGHDALAVDQFDLDPGAYYIVQVADGGSGDARASDYAPMEPGVSYELCDAYGVCRTR